MDRTPEEKAAFRVLSEEEKQRCLDFARRMCFSVWPEITEARSKKLWSDAEWFLTDVLEEGHVGYETGNPDRTFPACNWFSERFDEQYLPNTPRWDKQFEDGEEPKYYRQLSSVCRAALDVVDGMPGGVWGFTIADFKRMYDGKLPDWLDDGEWQIVNDGKAILAEAADDVMLPI